MFPFMYKGIQYLQMHYVGAVYVSVRARAVRVGGFPQLKIHFPEWNLNVK